MQAKYSYNTNITIHESNMSSHIFSFTIINSESINSFSGVKVVDILVGTSTFKSSFVKGLIRGIIRNSFVISGISTVDLSLVDGNSFLKNRDSGLKLVSSGLKGFLLGGIIFLRFFQNLLKSGDLALASLMGSLVGSNDGLQFFNVSLALANVDGEDVVLSLNFGLELQEAADSLLFVLSQLFNVALEFSNELINESKGLSDEITDSFIIIIIVVEAEGTLIVVNMTGTDLRFSSG